MDITVSTATAQSVKEVKRNRFPAASTIYMKRGGISVNSFGVAINCTYFAKGSATEKFQSSDKSSRGLQKMCITFIQDMAQLSQE